jgi:hypothetical protein
MKMRSIAPLIVCLLALGCLVGAAVWALTEWEEVEAQLSELETVRAQCVKVQQQALFPPEARKRAKLAQKDYLHHVVESQHLLRDEAARLEELAKDPLFANLRAIREQQKRLATNPTTLHFTARPAVTGTAFRDRLFLLTQPLEVDSCDVERLLELLEGPETLSDKSAPGRPLLFLTEFRLERRGQEGRWQLDLSLLEREWRGL